MHLSGQGQQWKSSKFSGRRLHALQSVVGLTGLLKNQKRKFVVLDNVSGVIKPGRMTLLLGPPGAGKSSLLKTLANKMKHEGCKVWH